jgi:hypothetical protein
MTDVPERISFRTGSLKKAMGVRIEQTKETPSEYLRRLVAEDLGIEPPKMVEGNPAFRAAAKNPK